MPANIEERCNAVEECYEFMLAYAAQGLPSDEGSQSGGQVREFLDRAVKALEGLAESYATAVKEEDLSRPSVTRGSLRCSTAMPATRSPLLSWFSPNRRSAPS